MHRPVTRPETIHRAHQHPARLSPHALAWRNRAGGVRRRVQPSAPLSTMMRSVRRSHDNSVRACACFMGAIRRPPVPRASAPNTGTRPGQTHTTPASMVPIPRFPSAQPGLDNADNRPVLTVRYQRRPPSPVPAVPGGSPARMQCDTPAGSAAVPPDPQIRQLPPCQIRRRCPRWPSRSPDCRRHG